MITPESATFCRIVLHESVEWENEYIPINLINDAHRIEWFTNFNEKLMKRIREIKSNI